jgi:hypothetical protein
MSVERGKGTVIAPTAREYGAGTWPGPKDLLSRLIYWPTHGILKGILMVVLLLGSRKASV